jgi:hypothetical protein
MVSHCIGGDMLAEWIIEGLKNGDEEAAISLAEIVAETEFEEPGSSHEIYDYLDELGIPY